MGLQSAQIQKALINECENVKNAFRNLATYPSKFPLLQVSLKKIENLINGGPYTTGKRL